MPVFFQELQRDGQIDRAMAWRAAPCASDRLLDAGAVYAAEERANWYVPGFGDEQDSFEQWPMLLRRIRSGLYADPGPGSGAPARLVPRDRPALGRDLSLPDGAARARRSAAGGPVPGGQPGVRLPARELGDYLHKELLRRYFGACCRTTCAGRAGGAVRRWPAASRARNAAEPYKVLAGLPFPIYITTNPDNLLEAALREAGKAPRWSSAPGTRNWSRLPDLRRRARLRPQRPAPAGLSPLRPLTSRTRWC